MRDSKPSKLSTIPPKGAMRVAPPVERIDALRPEPRRDPGQIYSPRVSAEMAAILITIDTKGS